MTEIYIVRQIDNTRLTKEVDYRRTKECLWLMSLGFFCLLIFLFLAWQQFEVIRDGYEGEVLKKEATQLSEENHQLILERASLRSPQRIDLIAKKKLGLIAPAHDQIVVLSTPFPTEPPATLVARSDKTTSEPGLAKLAVVR
ncbi:MAG: cell division protein FtsL [Acidobacteria bacterium]|nr:cell division protein FtsL [Acidobacteriota bacterium]MCI0621328.1 cell division protein FtsL [Acidobacteriota bacterium]MCI0720126.1 cell division protein FtsL [Acidobacteriota bacterium]